MNADHVLSQIERSLRVKCDVFVKNCPLLPVCNGKIMRALTQIRLCPRATPIRPDCHGTRGPCPTASPVARPRCDHTHEPDSHGGPKTPCSGKEIIIFIDPTPFSSQPLAGQPLAGQPLECVSEALSGWARGAGGGMGPAQATASSGPQQGKNTTRVARVTPVGQTPLWSGSPIGRDVVETVDDWPGPHLQRHPEPLCGCASPRVRPPRSAAWKSRQR